MKTHPLVPTLILTALAAGGLWPSALAEEPARRSPANAPLFVPFDVYPKHREAIGLNEDQVRELGRIAEGMGDASRHLESEMRARHEALQDALSQRPIEPQKAMERFQAVLQSENEMKALQFRSGIAAQNLLTPEQAEKMRGIAAKVAGSRNQGADINPSALRERLEQLRAELRKRAGGELSKEAVGTLERIEKAAQQGNMEEAKKGMEGLLAKLGHDAEPRRKETGNAQPSPAEIAQQIEKTEKELAAAPEGEKRERLQQQLGKLHKMQDFLAANPDASRREKNTKGEGKEPAAATFKGEGEKNKAPEKNFGKGEGEKNKTPEKTFVKGEGEKNKVPEKSVAKGEGEPSKAPEKNVVKGEGEPKKFDKNADNAKRPDPELRKRVEGALADFQEAKAAGNRDALEKITKSIEAMLRDSARDGGLTKDGARKEGAQKDGERKEGAQKDGQPKEGFNKDGARKEPAQKDGERKESAQKDGERKEDAPKEAARKDAARKEAPVEKP